MNNNGKSKDKNANIVSQEKISQKKNFKEDFETPVLKVSDEAPKAELVPVAPALPDLTYTSPTGDPTLRSTKVGDDRSEKLLPENSPAPLAKQTSIPIYAKNTAQKPPSAPGNWLCWFFIATTAVWVILPESYTWFDNKAELHKHQQKAVQAYFKGNKQNLKDECNAFLALQPDSAGAYFGRGYATLIFAGSSAFASPFLTQAALPDLTRACALAPQDYLFHSCLGLALAQSGHYDLASPVLERALSLEHSAMLPWPTDMVAKSTNDTAIRRQLAKSFLHQGEYEKAFQQYKLCQGYSTITSDDQAAEMLTNEYAHQPSQALVCGTAWAVYYPKPEEKFASLKLHNFVLERSLQASAENKKISPAMNLLYEGLCLHGLKKYDQAIERLSQAIALKSNYADFYLVRAACFRNNNQKDLALADLEKALQLDPENAFALNFKEKLLLKNYKFVAPADNSYWNYGE